MSKAKDLFRDLLVAGGGVSTAERQAQSRIKTRGYLDLTKKEMLDTDVLTIIRETETEIGVRRTKADAEKDVSLVEVYDAALSVFTTFSQAKAT